MLQLNNDNIFHREIVFFVKQCNFRRYFFFELSNFPIFFCENILVLNRLVGRRRRLALRNFPKQRHNLMRIFSQYFCSRVFLCAKNKNARKNRTWNEKEKELRSQVKSVPWAPELMKRNLYWNTSSRVMHFVEMKNYECILGKCLLMLAFLIAKQQFRFSCFHFIFDQTNL